MQFSFVQYRESSSLPGKLRTSFTLAVEYIYWFMPFLPFSALLSSGMFFVRLDGSLNYAMVCNIIPALINIILDYLFIFVFEWDMLRHKHYIHRLLSKHQT